MLALHSVEGSLIHMTVGDLEEVRQTNLKKDDEPVPSRNLEHVVEGKLGRRQERFARPVRKRWCGLFRGGLERQSLSIDATWRKQKAEASALVFRHGTATLSRGRAFLE